MLEIVIHFRHVADGFEQLFAQEMLEALPELEHRALHRVLGLADRSGDRGVAEASLSSAREGVSSAKVRS